MEDNSILMKDGVKRIFVNTHGKNKQDVSPEFVALMEFIEYNRDIGNINSNANLEKIIKRVSQIKSNEKVGVKYMQQWEVEAIIRSEGKEEGIKEGVDIVSAVVKCLKNGEDRNVILESGINEEVIKKAEDLILLIKS